MAIKWAKEPRKFSELPAGQKFAFTQNNAVHHGRIAERRNVFVKLKTEKKNKLHNPPNAASVASKTMRLWFNDDTPVRIPADDDNYWLFNTRWYIL